MEKSSSLRRRRSAPVASARLERRAITNDPDVIAVASNDLWRKRHTMTLQEQRLLVWLISRVQPVHDREFLPVTLTVQEFAKAIGHEGEKGSLYIHMQNVTKSVLNRAIYISEPDGSWHGFHWLHEARYTAGHGSMTLQLHPSLAPFILNLKERFAKVDVAQLMQLRGNYSISFYEYCCAQNYHSRQWTMTVEQMRSWLNIPEGEILRVQDLKRDVIARAKAELDRRCRLSFTFTDIKQSRRITGWTFKVIDNVPTAPRGGTGELPAQQALVPAPAAEPAPLSPEEIQERMDLLEKLKRELKEVNVSSAP